MVMLDKKIIYAVILMVCIFTVVEIWYVTNIVDFRQIGFMVWMGLLSMLILLSGMLLAYDYLKKKKVVHGVLVVMGVFIFDVFVMINFAPMSIETQKLFYYFLLMLTMSIFIVIGMIGNITRIEKKKEEGFNISIHEANSPISTRMIIPTWIAVFGLMFLLVSVGGHALLSYPQFGVTNVAEPLLASFPIGDAENIVYLIFSFEIAMMVFKWAKVPILAAKASSVIAGVGTFTGFHALVYNTNMVATIVVSMFALACILIYIGTRSLIVISAMHVGNNFWGAVYKKTVFGMSGFGGTGDGGLFTAGIVVLVIAISIVIVLKVFKNKNKRGWGIR